jgi:hypothetical protein
MDIVLDAGWSLVAPRRQDALLDLRIIALSFVINIVGKPTVRAWMRGAA